MKSSLQQISSCDCYNCKASNFNMRKQYPKNADTDPYFDCINKLSFKKQIEPSNKSGYEFINPKVISNAYASDFQKSDTNKYLSNDPRLISGAHNGQILELDRPPTDHHIKLQDIYTDPTMINYGRQYSNYSDIKAGDILYYTDKSIEDDLFYPLFENPANVEGVLYKDQMAGIAYPEYNRCHVYNPHLLKTKNRKFRYGLSSLNDTNEFREDLMHLQMRTQDRKRYVPRWTGDTTY